MRHLFVTLLLLVLVSAIAAQPEPEYPVFSKLQLTDSVVCTPVQDQSQSPTCWAFGTNSLFESDLIKKYNLRLNLSEMFLARHAYIDKARRYLATGTKTYFAGGGQFHDVIRVIEQHGIVPEEIYTGRPRGEFHHDHAQLDSGMKRMLDQMVQSGHTTLTDKDLQRLNDTLDRYLGKLPTRFIYQRELYTPQTFAEQVTRFKNDYLELVSFSDQPLYRKFILRDKYNWAEDSFYNITLSDMLMVIDTALARGWSVGWEGDVTNNGFNYFNGTASLPDSARNFDQDRLINYKNETTERDHMLQIVAVGRDEHNRKWYYMKNSWGIYFSKYKGFLYMEENFFKLQTVILMVNKAALPGQLKTKLGLN